MPVFHRHGFDNTTKGNRVVASYSEALLVAGGCRVVNFDLLVYLPVVVLL